MHQRGATLRPVSQRQARRSSALLACAAVLLAAGVASGATLTVNGVADANPPNTSDGVCSLREAITAINNGGNFGDCSGTGYGTNDTVNFNIAPDDGLVKTIVLADVLDAVVKPMTINGYSQPQSKANTLAVGSDAKLLIEIDKSGFSGVAFRLNGNGPSPGFAGSTIKGLVISHVLAGNAITMTANNNTIAGNFIGTDPTGTAISATQSLIETFSTSGHTIGGATPAARNVLASHSNLITLTLCGSSTIQGN